MHERGGGHWGKNICSSVRAELFWCPIYCANRRPDPKYQYGSWYRRGLGRQSLWIIQEYDLTTVISIWPMNHPRTCEMGSSSFSIMDWLKFERMTKAAFPSMTSTERVNGGNFFPFLVAVITVVVFLFLVPTSQKLVYWLIFVGICLSISKYDIDYGISLDFP